VSQNMSFVPGKNAEGSTFSIADLKRTEQRGFVTVLAGDEVEPSSNHAHCGFLAVQDYLARPRVHPSLGLESRGSESRLQDRSRTRHQLKVEDGLRKRALDPVAGPAGRLRIREGIF
jgi:hypothetical protein